MVSKASFMSMDAAHEYAFPTNTGELCKGKCVQNPLMSNSLSLSIVQCY